MRPTSIVNHLITLYNIALGGLASLVIYRCVQELYLAHRQCSCESEDADFLTLMLTISFLFATLCFGASLTQWTRFRGRQRIAAVLQITIAVCVTGFAVWQSVWWNGIVPTHFQEPQTVAGYVGTAIVSTLFAFHVWKNYRAGANS
jgi:hypothetical protein